MRFATISLAAAVSALFMAGMTQAQNACNPAQCIFPACLCPSASPPKGMDPKTVPQFFTLTYDDAIQAPTVPVAASLMTPHRNPNGCPIKATWFAQTLYSDFALIQQWYAAGNEVADHTMNHIGTPPLGKSYLFPHNLTRYDDPAACSPLNLNIPRTTLKLIHSFMYVS